MLISALLGAHFTYIFKDDYQKGRRRVYMVKNKVKKDSEIWQCEKERGTLGKQQRKAMEKKNPNFCNYVCLGLRLCQTLDLEAVLSLIHCTWLSVARKTFFVVLKRLNYPYVK